MNTLLSIQTVNLTPFELSFQVVLSEKTKNPMLATVSINSVPYQVFITENCSEIITLPIQSNSSPYLKKQEICLEVQDYIGGDFEQVDKAPPVHLEMYQQTCPTWFLACMQRETDQECLFAFALSNPPETPCTLILQIGKTEQKIPLDTNGEGSFIYKKHESYQVACETVTITNIGVEGGNYADIRRHTHTFSVKTMQTKETVTLLLTKNPYSDENNLILDCETDKTPEYLIDNDITVTLEIGKTTKNIFLDRKGKGQITIPLLYAEENGKVTVLASALFGGFEQYIFVPTKKVFYCGTKHKSFTVTINVQDVTENEYYIAIEVRVQPYPFLDDSTVVLEINNICISVPIHEGYGKYEFVNPVSDNSLFTDRTLHIKATELKYQEKIWPITNIEKTIHVYDKLREINAYFEKPIKQNNRYIIGMVLSPKPKEQYAILCTINEKIYSVPLNESGHAAISLPVIRSAYISETEIHMKAICLEGKNKKIELENVEETFIVKNEIIPVQCEIHEIERKKSSFVLEFCLTEKPQSNAELIVFVDSIRYTVQLDKDGIGRLSVFEPDENIFKKNSQPTIFVSAIRGGGFAQFIGEQWCNMNSSQESDKYNKSLQSVALS